MTSSVLVLIIGALCVYECGADDVALTDQMRNVIVDLHNQARSEEPATNMATMVWDTSLEQEAQSWTDGCQFLHQTGQSWGENLSAKTYRSGDDVNALLGDMFQQWMNEKDFNTGGTFSECCSQSSYQCCHYTQVIWAKSTNVGCGLTYCPTLTTYSGSMSRALYLACYYTPRGNSPEATCTWDWSPYKTA